jgi:hypothetical protein
VPPGPAPLLPAAGSAGFGTVPGAGAAPEVVPGACMAGEASGAELPVEPGPAPLLLCAASPVDCGGRTALVPVVGAVESSARAENEMPRVATVNSVSNDFDFIFFPMLRNVDGYRLPVGMAVSGS